MKRAESFLDEKGRRTGEALAAYLDRYADAPPRLIEAMRYSLLAPGKRLRPALVLGACDLVAGDDAPAVPAACAIEMIHTYSLIHDDLPSMDDDDVRRGQPSCHVAFGEALAILAGDAMLTLAFEVLAEAADLRVIREIARAAGPHGMAGGQVLDLEAEGRALDRLALETIHRMKTGALICSAVRIGAMVGGADQTALDALTEYGRHLGLSFQITDDLLDVTGHAETIGKTAGKDARQGKSTYPGLVGIVEAHRLADDAVRDARNSLAPFGARADDLRALAEYTVTRQR